MLFVVVSDTGGCLSTSNAMAAGVACAAHTRHVLTPHVLPPYISVVSPCVCVCCSSSPQHPDWLHRSFSGVACGTCLLLVTYRSTLLAAQVGVGVCCCWGSKVVAHHGPIGPWAVCGLADAGRRCTMM